MEREDWIHSNDPRRAAAAWHALIESESLGEGERRALVDWLRKSPTHLAEYLRLEAVREQLRDEAVFAGLTLESLQAQIASSVDTLPQLEAFEPVRAIKSRRRFRLRLSAAATIVICLAAWLVWYAPQFGPLQDAEREYAAGIGEQRSIVLDDGSIVELNTRSRLTVRYTSTTREITLSENGEALFRVAKDVSRPFRVISGETVTQAVGTEFTVRHDTGRTTITVLEGKVVVGAAETLPVSRRAAQRTDPSASRLAMVEIIAGQQLAIATGKDIQPAAIQAVSPEAAVAWKARRLVFDDLPLEAVLAEFNRYNVRQILIAGKSASTQRITGVFNANDPDSFLSFLQGAEGVRVTTDASGNVVIYPPSAR